MLVFVEPSPSRPSDTASREDTQWTIPRRPSPSARQYKDRYWLHALLFLLTVGCTVVGGGLMAGRFLLYGTEHLSELLTNQHFLGDGLRYSLALLGFLTVHEFGHYTAARWHGIATSLPYYIPFPLSIIGTLGAVIRIREPIPDRRKLFDVGAAGPLAGFVVALGLLLYALVTLPDPSYLLDQPGHEAIKEYIQQHGAYPAEMLSEPGENVVVPIVGKTLLYSILKPFFQHVPPMYEMLHFPVLFAAWLGLFFTALNLLPVGQLDGGHITYALFGRKWHARIARVFTTLLLFSGAIGFMRDVAPWLYDQYELLGQLSWFILAGILYFFLSRVYRGDHRFVAPVLLALVGGTGLAHYIGPAATRFGWTPWLLWCLLIIYLIRVDHPPVRQQKPLTPRRRVLGVLGIIIFVLCFSFRPFYIL